MLGRVWLLVLMVMGVTVGVLSSVKGQDGGGGGGGGSGEIVLGHYAAMTGTTAVFGNSADKGARLALEEINSSGGVLGRQLRLVTEDTQSKPEEAVTAVQKLINQDKVVAILGEIASSRSIAAAPICQKAKIPMLSPASTNPKVTQKGNYIFRACFIDPFQGTAMADFAMTSDKGPHAKRIAVFYDVKNDYSLGLREFFVARAKEKGAEIVADESYGEGDKDFRAQLQKIKLTNPDAVWCPGYYSEIALIIKQARELGLNVPFLGGDGWDADILGKTAGLAINGCFFSNHYASDDPTPAVQDFIAHFKAKYNGELPDAMAILGYDSMKLMADAISRAGSTDGKAIRDALAKTKDFGGAAGKITIDKDRNAQKPLVVLSIKVTDAGGGDMKQKFEYVDTVKP
jgi:branched-chain amino acid transport system substrate-binding protein